MDWSNERYVRLYTRNTAEWMALAWQAKALLPLMLRACDRSGVMQVRAGPNRARLVAGLVGLPLEVVEPGLADLLVDECLMESELGYVFRNFIEAQEAPASNKLLVKESRERRKVRAMSGDRKSVESDRKPVVSERNPVETDTPSRAVLSRAEPNQKPLRESPVAPPPGLGEFRLEPTAPEAKPSKPSEWEELRDRLDDARVRARPECPDDPGFCAKREEANSVLRQAVRWLAEKYPGQDAKVLIRKAAWVYATDDWPGKQTGMTPWSLWVFVKRKHLGAYAAKAAQLEGWKHDELEDLWHPPNWSSA